MTITRIVSGEPHEFTLTQQELCNAYYEQQESFDRNDVEDILIGFDNDECMKLFGVSRETLLSLVDEIAIRMRSYMDKYDLCWTTARDEAIEDEVEHFKDIHGIN